MAVGIRVGNIIDEIGAPELFRAFFSTISYHLEPKGWGTRYPELMKMLYQKGRLPLKHAPKVYQDLISIREQMKAFSPDQIVWDRNSPGIQSAGQHPGNLQSVGLSNYFMTSTGRDVFSVLLECVEALQDEGGELTVENYSF